MKYHFDSEYNKIANIPYDDYIKNLKTPDNAVVPQGLSAQNSAEENGKAIQSAIDKLNENGGIILIPKGRYKTNTIILKSNTTLFIPKGAELVSISCEDNEKSSAPLYKAVIYAENAENISITGGGTISGDGLSYMQPQADPTPLFALEKFNTRTRVLEARKRIRMGKDTSRNHIVNFRDCKNITIENIIFKDSAFWTCRFDNCFDVKIENFIIDSDIHLANSDGIDICGGENYDISHCFIATADDSLCLKSIEFPIKNVRINDCVVTSCANCFKIGTETQFDVSNVSIDNCFFFMPDSLTYGYSGIAIESCDGANIKNINISNITMDGVSSPLLIWLGKRLRCNKQDIGTIDGIALKNISATNIEMPCAIVGTVDMGDAYPVKNVKIDNFFATYRDTEENLNIKNRVGEYTMGGYPDIPRVSHVYFMSQETSGYWDLPCYSVCVKHTENVQYENIKIMPRSCNTRKEFYLDDIK